MLDTGLLGLLETSLPDEVREARAGKEDRTKRLALTQGERRRGDERTAQRLVRLGHDPFRSSRRLFQDVEVEPGRLFEAPAYRERWAFAGEAGKRAARTSAEFDLFKQGRDLSNARHVILRPRPVKAAPGAVRIAKAAPGDLAAELERFADSYNRFTKRLVTEGLLSPLLTVVHIRFDTKLNSWDVHAHCLWDIANEHLDTVRRRIGTKFSTPWREAKPIKNPAAVVNYMTQWVVDHRELARWPDAALGELWGLERPRFIRPAGEFAVFRRQIADHRLERSGDIVTAQPRKPRQMRREACWNGPGHDGVVGYVRLRLDGRRRLCAVLAASPERSPTSGQGAGGLATMPEAPARGYSTTNLGITLPEAGQPPFEGQPSSKKDSPRQRPSLSARSVPARKWWLWQAWPSGSKAKISRPESPGKPARPIQRRIRRFLEIQARKALARLPDGLEGRTSWIGQPASACRLNRVYPRRTTP